VTFCLHGTNLQNTEAVESRTCVRLSQQIHEHEDNFSQQRILFQKKSNNKNEKNAGHYVNSSGIGQLIDSGRKTIVSIGSPSIRAIANRI